MWSSVLLFATTQAAAATCEAPLSLSALRGLMDEVEHQYVAMDLDAFRRSIDAVALQLPCLDAVLPTADAARYHRLQGLQAAVVRDIDRARMAFLAARSAEPDTQLSENLVPEGHPVRIHYAALPLDSITWEPLPLPRSGQVQLDGRPQDRRPRSCPTIVQVLDEWSQVQSTTYLWPEQPLPYSTDPDPLAPPTTARRSPAPLLLAGAGAVGLGAGAMTWLAAQSHSTYDDPATPRAELDALRTQTNRYNTAAIGMGAGALGLGVAATLTWTW